MLNHIKTVEVGNLLVLSQCRVSEYCGRSINTASETKDLLIFGQGDTLFLERLKVIKSWFDKFESSEQALESVQKLSVYTSRVNEFVSVA